MASGCIMGDCPCPVCDELVWEDDWDYVDTGKELIFIHPECKGKANGLMLRIKKLEDKVEQLEASRRIGDG